MAGNITDFAILIDKNLAIATLPTGTVRAAASGQSQKIVIGNAATLATPFCNGIYDGTQYLPFIALPADPNFSGQFVIIGRVVSDPTYWGCSDTAALIAQCLVLNGGNDAAPSFSDFGQEIANCKTWLDANGYALSNSASSFLAGYFP
jgi:hypothetical protein